MGAMLGFLIQLAILVLVIAGMWKVFTKANQPGWGCLIPFYNIYLMLLIAGKPAWWLVLCLIPGVNFVIGIIASIAVAKNFGKDVGFGIGLALLPFVFFPILGFGSAQYAAVPPAAA